MKKNRNTFIISLVIIFFISLISIAYSAFTQNLAINDISASVRITKDIRITGISIESSSSGVVSIEDYNVKNISGSVTLPNSDSYITYKVEVTNISNAIMGIKSIEGLPDNLEYEILNYNLKDKICDNTDKCNLGIKKEILIKIKYKDNMYNSGNIDNNFVLNFDFDQIYNVNITGLDSLADYPTTVINGDNYVIEIGPNYNINVNIDGISTNNFTYENGILTIPNVTGDLGITVTEEEEEKSNIKAQLLSERTVSAASTITNVRTSTEAGLFSLDTASGTTYFFRGNVTNNYISFANKCFKMVRINENETVKAVYIGEANANGSCSTTITSPTSLANKVYNTTANSENNLRYAYDNNGTIVSSNAKTILDSWFETSFVGSYSSTNKEYASYFGDGDFCNEIVEDHKYKTDIYYTSYARVTDGSPSLECPNSDRMTLKVSNGGTSGYGNNLLTYPVGLLSSDEILYTSVTSEARASLKLATDTYLYSSGSFYTMSPAYTSSNAYIIALGSSKIEKTVSSSANLLPAVNFSSDVSFESGDGTSTNPYKIKY